MCVLPVCVCVCVCVYTLLHKTDKCRVKDTETGLSNGNGGWEIRQ